MMGAGYISTPLGRKISAGFFFICVDSHNIYIFLHDISGAGLSINAHAPPPMYACAGACAKSE